MPPEGSDCVCQHAGCCFSFLATTLVVSAALLLLCCLPRLLAGPAPFRNAEECRRLGVRLLCCEPLSMLVAAPLHSDDDFQLPWCQPCSAEPQHQSSGRAAAAAGRSPKRSADGVGLKLMARQPRGTTARQWHGLPSWRGVLFAEEVQVSRPAWQSSRYLHRELQGTLVDHVWQHCLASCRGKSACCY